MTLAASGETEGGVTDAVELVCLLQPGGQGLVKLRAETGWRRLWFSGLHRRAAWAVRRSRTVADLAGTDGEPVVGSHLGSGLLGVHRVLLAQHDAVVDAVLDVRGLVGRAGKRRSLLVSLSVKSSGTSPSQ